MYEILKSLHLIAVICWMAGLLYLPRLFVYHCEAEAGSQMDFTFQKMERRLYRFIMSPAMLLTWVFGLWLAFAYTGFSPGWLQAKLALVVVLTGVNHYLGYCLKLFKNNKNYHSQRFYRILNEVPALLMIAIVILVITKPF